MTPEPAGGGRGRGRSGVILAICVATGFTTLLDQAVFTMAIPSLRDGIDATPAQLQLILAVYSLAFGIALVPAGRLGDIRGRRALFLGGMAVFTGFSFLGGFAPSPEVIIVARLLQGIGGGVVNTQVMGLIQDEFRGSERARALGAYAAAAGLSGAAGPFIGGVLLTALPDDWGWRSLFLMNVPFGVAVIAAAWRHLPRRRARNAGGRVSLDPGGLLLLGVFTSASILATLLVDDGPGTGVYVAVAAGAVVLFAVWEILYQRRGGTPVLGVELLRSPGYLLGSTVAMFKFASGLTLGAVGVLLFLDGLGLSALFYGALAVPRSLGMLYSSARSWRFVARWGRPGISAVIVATIVVTGIEVGLVLSLPPAGIVAAFAVTGAVQGVLGGLVQAPNQALTLDSLSGDDGRGVAAGFLQLVQRLMSAIGVAVGTGIFLTVAGASPGLADYRHGYAAAALLAVGFSAAAGAAAIADTLRRRRGGDPGAAA